MKEWVTEMCPYCMEEQNLEWDVEKYGGLVYCPTCGHRLLLCDYCTHNGESYDCNNCKYNKPMTNYDSIRNMTVEEMAEMFYELLHLRDTEIQKQIQKSGIDSTLLEMPSEAYISVHKKWLESVIEK